MHPLSESETDAPVASDWPLFLAYDKPGDEVWDVLGLTFTPQRRDKAKPSELEANLLGAADSLDSGVVLLIDSTTATGVECDGKR